MALILTKRPTIAKYPEFTKLQLKHKRVFDRYAHRFGYYCDFNFANLFSWDIDDNVNISFLNSNLIIRRQDYVKGKYFYSLLGSNKIDETLEELLEDVKVLNFVPDVVVRNIKNKEEFRITSERDNYDYIFNVKDLVELKGKKYKNVRNRLNKFKKEFADYDKLSVVTTSVVNLDRFKCFQDVFYTWEISKGLCENETDREKRALNRLLEHSHYLNLLIIEIKLGDELVAFSINNIASPGYAVTHFEKAIKIHKYFTSYVIHECAKMQDRFGINTVNWEDDLGYPGLRQNKSSYRPTEMLNKYQIRFKK
jgi:hypothetical protein